MLRRLSSRWPLLAVAGASLLAGCDRSPPTDRYRPSPDAARAALEAVLDAWKGGRPAGTIADRKPQIKVVDSRQKPETAIKGFSILGEVAAEGYRGFAVRLEHPAPGSVERVRYVVIGIDPLWVFREEDYDMLAHWDHAMSPAPPADETPLLPEFAADE